MAAFTVRGGSTLRGGDTLRDSTPAQSQAPRTLALFRLRRG